MAGDVLQQIGFVRDEREGVWVVPSSAKPFAYSDGDVESWIYERLGQCKDLSTSSAELEEAIRDWPTRYHLSPMRSSLLRPIAHLLQGSVIEVGAGCGAISRYLVETARHVTAIEGSLRRANVARRRCRERDNIDVVCTNFMDFGGQNIETLRSDAVTLIGVLEYSRKFVEAADPVQGMLEHCRRYLNDDGVLVIAIENQLGLKYFAGAPEDHEAKPFYGIHDSYTDNEAVTFGRQELTRRLHAAGFAGVQFFYPFPDYKLPNLVLTERGARAPDDVLVNLTSMFAAQDQDRAYSRHFSEQASWPSLMRNGLVPDLSNSFLVVAKKTPLTGDAALCRDPNDLAYVYSIGRAKQFRKENVLRAKGDEVEVVRQRLHPKLSPSHGPLKQVVHDEVAVHGPLMSTEFINIVNRAGWHPAHVAKWALPWVQMVDDIRRKEGSLVGEMPHVPGRYIDLTPFNLIRRESGELAAIDLEWDVGAAIPAHWVLLRGLLHSFLRARTVAPPAHGTPMNLLPLVQSVLAMIKWELSADECASLARLEDKVFDGALEDALHQRLEIRS